MIDLPPIPWPVALAVIGWGAAVLGLTWRAGSRLSAIEGRLSHVESEVGDDITGRRAVANANDRLTRIEARLDGQESALARIEAKLDARG